MNYIIKCTHFLEGDAASYFECFIKRKTGRKKLGVVDFEHDASTIQASARIFKIKNASTSILLTNFEAKERGLGKKLFCRVLKTLALQGFTHILLNAVPKPDIRYDVKNARQKLIANYRKLGFRLMDPNSGAMKATITTSVKKCNRLSTKWFDHILGLRTSVE